MNKYKLTTAIIITVLVALNIYQFQQNSSINKKLENQMKVELNSSFLMAKEMLPKELKKVINRKQISEQEFSNLWSLSNTIFWGIDDAFSFAKKYDIYSNDGQSPTNKLAGEVQSFYRDLSNKYFQDDLEAVSLSERELEYLIDLKELAEQLGNLAVSNTDLLSIKKDAGKVIDISVEYEEKLNYIRLF